MRKKAIYYQTVVHSDKMLFILLLTKIWIKIWLMKNVNLAYIVYVPDVFS